MSIKDPTAETGLVWILTWGNAESVKHTVASIIQSFDYLISDNINQGEADRRLRLLRAAWKELVSHGPLPGRVKPEQTLSAVRAILEKQP